MRKILAFTLAAAMTLTTTATAFASDLNNGSKDVTATYHEGQTSDIIYSVDVAWGSMEFNYTSPAQGTWNPETHNYDNPGITGTWTYAADANKLTVTNHTNAEVTAAFTYTAAADYAAVTGSFDKATLTLPTAVGTKVDAAPSASAFLTLSGELPETETAVTVGSITVTLNK